MGVVAVEVEGRPVSAHVVEAAGRRLEGRKFLLATGSRPAIPPVDGLRDAGFVTHEDAFDRAALPGSSVILGGGAIGVEFAQAYRRLGVEVTLVEMAGRILPREDREISAAVTELLREEGVSVRAGQRAVRAERRNDGTAVLELEDAGGSRGGGTDAVEAEELFVAAGSSPNVESLGLEEVGVEVGDAGIAVDDRLRTSLPHVFAAGDVIGGHQFTHVADHEARTVIRNALFPFSSPVDYTVIPWAIFTDPPVARVGLTEEEARQRHGDGVGVVRYDLADLDRAITERQARGMVKIVVDRQGRIVGGHLLGEDAGSVIMELALAVREDVKLGSLSDLVHPYPTMSEGLRRAADEYRRAGLTPLVQRWLDRWFRLARRLDL
jgi:pyruvate/2-oxoglutarate dehydrogenase complex dihydrolipoamide dehydrogenase (E3) component